MHKLSSRTDPKFDLRSVCDLWSVNREKAAADAEQRFSLRPKMFQYSEEMPADRERVAVMIGTGVIMATRSYREGKKLYWDRKNEQILDYPPAV